MLINKQKKQLTKILRKRNNFVKINQSILFVRDVKG